MCSALLVVINSQDPSTSLLDSLVTALLSSYDETEISTIEGKATCARVLGYIGKLSSLGYLRGARPNTTDFYAEITSQFIASVNSPRIRYFSNATSPKRLRSLQKSVDPQEVLENHVKQALKGLTTGVLKAMVNGQVCIECI